MKRLVFGLLLLLTTTVHAETYLNWGVAFGYPNGNYSDIQNLAVGKRGPFHLFDYVLEFGAWRDPGHYPGAASAAYATSAIGLDLKLREKYVSYHFGPCIVSRTDSILGLPFQVYQKASIGFRDSRDRRIGVFVKHFSNGGISHINKGRNFVGAEISF